jgi:hypothetical protein
MLPHLFAKAQVVVVRIGPRGDVTEDDRLDIGAGRHPADLFPREMLLVHVPERTCLLRRIHGLPASAGDLLRFPLFDRSDLGDQEIGSVGELCDRLARPDQKV